VASVTDDRVMLEGREVWISRPADSEALLTDEAFEREEFLPYWADLWPSAIELAHVVARWDLAGRRVLELGCGLALPGIAAALRGGRVTVSAIDTAWPAAIGPSAPTTAARDRSCRPSATANSHPIAGLMP